MYPVRSRSASDAPISFTPRQPVHQSLSSTQGGTSFLCTCTVSPPLDPNRCLKGPSSTQGRGPHSPALGAGEWGGGREWRSEIKFLPLVSEYMVCGCVGRSSKVELVLEHSLGGYGGNVIFGNVTVGVGREATIGKTLLLFSFSRDRVSLCGPTPPPQLQCICPRR